MKVSMKKIMTLALAIALLLTLSVTALAAETPAIGIQLDGQTITVDNASPIMKDERTFLPFRGVFEALGATVDYDAASKTITAQRGDITAKLVIGQANVAVTTAGTTKNIEAEAVAYEENGVTYVPVRVAAEVLGCNVGWDSTQQTVLIVDTEKLLQSYEGKFSLMDKWLAASQKQPLANQAFTGTMKMTLNINDNGQIVPLVLDADITGISSAEVANMDMDMALDLDALLDELTEEEKNDPALQEMLAQLKNIKLEYIVNLTDGKIYLRAPLFSQLFLGSTTENAWLYMDINELFSSMGMGSLKDLLAMSQNMNMNDVIALMVPMVTNLDSVNDYAELTKVLDTMEMLLGDKAFVQDGNTYTSNFEMTQDGVTISFTCSFEVENDVVVSSHVALDIKDTNNNGMQLEVSTPDVQNSTMTMTFKMADLMDLILEMTVTSQDTTEEPIGAPANGEQVIDLFNPATSSNE